MRPNTPKILVPSQVKKRKRWKFFKRVFLIIILLFASTQLYRTNKILGQIQSGDLREIGQLQEDINDVRRFLDLPVKENNDLEVQKETLESELFSIVAQFSLNDEAQEQSDAAKKAYSEAQALKEVTELVQKKDYSSVEDFDFTMILYKGEDLVSFGAEESSLFISTSQGKQYYESEKFIDALKTTISGTSLNTMIASKSKLKKGLEVLEALRSDPDVLALLKSKDLKIQSAENSVVNTGLYEAKIIKLDDGVAGGITYSFEANEHYLSNEKGVNVSGNQTTKEGVKKALISYLEDGEFLTLLDQDVKASITQVSTLIKTKEFKSALEAAGLSFASISETTSETYFNFNSDSESAMKIVIDKSTAQIFSEIEGERVPLNVTVQADLYLDEQVKKNDKINVLIAGKHGSLTDTIIFAHIDTQKKTIKLVSLPRDLYIDGQKINAMYLDSGMPGLVEQVEEITGMQIQNYVMIDMYAFIDVVDFLGGIDVTLDAPLVDPTYKTFDEGEWGTLYYKAGTHHLSGVQALRIARSRHYSSDFERAKRQHKILYGLREKGKNLSIKDAGKLLQIAVTLLNKTDTDISAKEGLNYFLKYKNYTIDGQNVLSSGNVLTSTYSNIYNGSVSASCTDCFKGAYILTPKNDDWRLVRSYIYNILRN